MNVCERWRTISFKIVQMNVLQEHSHLAFSLRNVSECLYTFLNVQEIVFLLRTFINSIVFIKIHKCSFKFIIVRKHSDLSLWGKLAYINSFKITWENWKNLLKNRGNLVRLLVSNKAYMKNAWGLKQFTNKINSILLIIIMTIWKNLP